MILTPARGVFGFLTTKDLASDGAVMVGNSAGRGSDIRADVAISFGG